MKHHCSITHHKKDDKHSLVHLKRSCHKSKWVSNRLYRRPALKCHLNWRTQRSSTGLLYPEVYHHIISCLTWLKSPNLSMNKNTWIRGVQPLVLCWGRFVAIGVLAGPIPLVPTHLADAILGPAGTSHKLKWHKTHFHVWLQPRFSNQIFPLMF